VVRTSSTIIAGAVAALLLAPVGTAQAAPGTRAESPLRVSVVCVQGLVRLDVTWRALSRPASYRVSSDRGTASPQAEGTGWQDAHVRLEALDGPTTVRLLADDVEIAHREVIVPPCDGWSGLEGYLASGAADPGSPQSVGTLTGRTSAGSAGTVVHEASGGDVVVLRDGTTHVVRGSIDAYWRQTGGALGWLHDPDSSEVETPDGSGFSTTFQNGSIWWSPATGAHSVRGPAYGVGLDGDTWWPAPGYPTDDGAEVLRGDGTLAGSYQHFENGVHYRWMLGSGYVYAGPLLDAYAATGYESGRLGWLIGDAEKFRYGTGLSNDPDSWRQRFQFGAIYAPLAGTVSPHVVQGAIAAYYQGRDAADFSLVRRFGYPVTDELGTPDGLGRYNHFANDTSVYWTQATGAHEVVGSGFGFRGYWASRGWERSTLGYPTASEVALTRSNGFDTRGGVQQFSGGNAYARWDPAVGAYRTATVRGAFLSAWGAMGWEGSSLGYPVSEEFPVAGGVRQTFQGGALEWNAATGAVTVVP
jgi:uncharacterized protein with LGFP repeats